MTPGISAPGGPLVSVEDLHVEFHTDAGVVKAVDGVTWSIAPGETLGIVGESGSGKSVSALALMGLVQQPPAKISGKILFRGRDLLTASEDELRSLRGRDISMIFQDPLTALNPVFKVGHQVAEVIQAHEKIGRIPARKRAVEFVRGTDEVRRVSVASADPLRGSDLSREPWSRLIEAKRRYTASRSARARPSSASLAGFAASPSRPRRRPQRPSMSPVRSTSVCSGSTC